MGIAINLSNSSLNLVGSSGSGGKRLNSLKDLLLSRAHEKKFFLGRGSQICCRGYCIGMLKGGRT